MHLTFRALVFPAFTGLALLTSTGARANNIQVANSALIGNNGTTLQVQFDLSWENSWRGGGVANWDAAWVFVKYRTSVSGPWSHANLNNTGHVAAAGSQIDLGLLTPGTAYDASTNPAVGVFIYRNAVGNGTLNLPATQLQWNFSALGLAFNDIAQVQVYAIEMVYVPQGAFFVGSGGTETGSLTNGSWTAGATIPLQITSESTITIAQTAGNLWGTSTTGGSTIGAAGTLPAAYPKGFAAYYMMKYETTQQGYVDFLNSLTYDQQVTRTVNAPSSAPGTGAMINPNSERNGIDIETSGVASTTPAVYACNLNGNTTYGESTDGKDLACSRISSNDLLAYLDWCGLRPMTELEFEKACRGPLTPLPNEYPWGTATINAGGYTLSNSGANNEGIAANYSLTAGNALYSNFSINGPIRVGIFAANGSNSGRVSAGAGYYGAMELGGNLNERTVTVGNAQGRAFTGFHGNGSVSITGDQNVTNWPVAAVGMGQRNGSFSDGSSSLQTCERQFAVHASDFRNNRVSGRGVRGAQ